MRISRIVEKDLAAISVAMPACFIQKQPSKGARRKKCFENIATLHENTHAKVLFQ